MDLSTELVKINNFRNPNQKPSSWAVFHEVKTIDQKVTDWHTLQLFVFTLHLIGKMSLKRTTTKTGVSRGSAAGCGISKCWQI